MLIEGSYGMPGEGSMHRHSSESRSASRCTSTNSRVSTSDHGLPVSEETKKGGHQCSECCIKQIRVDLLEKERDRQFDKVVKLTRGLEDKTEECDTLRHTVNELTCRCRNIEQELSLKTDQNVSLTQQLKEKEELLSKFTHRMVAEHALVHEQEGTTRWTSGQTDQQGSASNPPQEDIILQQFHTLHLSVKSWYAEHGSKGTPEQLFATISGQGQKQLADSFLK
jgi:hypothetical protein